LACCPPKAFIILFINALEKTGKWFSPSNKMPGRHLEKPFIAASEMQQFFHVEFLMCKMW
jgi:hypothetical protein